MSEIEKLMQNAEIEPEWQDCCKLADKYWDNENLADEYVCFDHYMKAVCPHNQECTDECKHAYDRTIYPEFTAEKQLELIKWLANNKDIEISEHFMDLKIKRTYCVSRRGFQFEESLAELVNLIWQSLTDTEKAEIKRILK